MGKVIAIIGLGFVAYYWAYTQKLKSMAILHAKKHCQHLGIQLLDHTAIFNRFVWQANSAGKKRLLREYLFDFTSTGEERYQGKILLQAHRMAGIELEAYSIN
jgi:hypothetical protein